MTEHDVLPLLTVCLGLVAIVLGFLAIAIEHRTSPFLQRASTGILMFGVLCAVDEACRCAAGDARIDWRLTLFVIGLAGGWGYRVFPHFCGKKETASRGLKAGTS